MLPRVFISYRRGDFEHAQSLRDVIAATSPVFLDKRIRGGDEYPERIADNISACDVVLMLIGPDWIAKSSKLSNPDDWVRQEFDQAQRENKQVIPLCVGVQAGEASEKVPESMGKLKRINFEELGADIHATMCRVGVFYPVKLPEKLKVEASGRDAEMQWLDEQLFPGRAGRPMINLFGPPGIGKSRLALEYAFKFGRQQRYSGGLCWIDVKGESAADEVVDFFGTHLRFEPDGKSSKERVARGWERWCADYLGPKLVIFDDVDNADQVEGLVPNNRDGIDVLVTSRQELGLSASVPRRIPTVADADVFEMLSAYAREAGRSELPDESDAATEELCRIAGGLPLAIRLLGGYLGRSTEEVPVFVDELRERGIAFVFGDDQQMKALVDVVWEGINTEGILLASILSLFNAPPYTWTLAGGIRRNDRSDEARRISARDISSFHEGSTTPIHAVLRNHFIQKLASEAPEIARVWSVLADHFVFQQFIYDSQYLANALDTVRQVQRALPKSNATAHLVLDKLVAHACYGDHKKAREALQYFARLLTDTEPRGVRRWYAIFAADHAQNLLVTRFGGKEAEGFEFTAAELVSTVHGLLPSDLLQTETPPGAEALPFLLRAAHFYGHQGNQRSYALYQAFESLNAEDFATQEDAGCRFYYRAAIFRLASLRFSSPGAFRKHVTPLLAEIQAPPWLDSPLNGSHRSEFSVERFNSDAQGFGDTAHQLRGLGDVQIWAYLYWQKTAQRGMKHRGASPNERLAEVKRTLDLTTKLWNVAEATTRQGEKPIQYYLWLADLEEKFGLATAYGNGHPIDDWGPVAARVAHRHAELEKKFGLRYEWARSKSIEQLKKFHTLVST